MNKTEGASARHALLGILILAISLGIPASAAIPAANASTLVVRRRTSAQPGIDVGVGCWFYNWYTTIPDPEFERDCDRAAELGAKIVRVEFRWDVVEPSKGSFSWDIMDYIVNTVVNRAKPQKILMTLTNSASWAVPSGAGKDYWRTPPTDFEGYKDYLNAIVQRYKDRIMYWEIWIEPNLSQYWLGTATDYVNLLRASYGTIKAADPNANVLGGAVSGSDYGYVSTLYTLDAKNYFDILSLHPYANPHGPDEIATPDTYYYPTVTKVLDVMAQNGDQDKPVWFAELAWAKEWSNWGGVTAENQADYLKTSFSMASQSWPQVKAYVWFTSRDTEDGNWGLYEPDGSKRPSWYTFQELAQLP